MWIYCGGTLFCPLLHIQSAYAAHHSSDHSYISKNTNISAQGICRAQIKYKNFKNVFKNTVCPYRINPDNLEVNHALQIIKLRQTFTEDLMLLINRTG